ncbi:hypothetical protein GM661_11840 [Iocasia frigidifontis]|uniref:Uncharacterized protein n=1 Tax=Iocasia fonsfrigidae TaxID=2682810 RepID=A0A8A7KET8_9FIRM|nr:hypothetical protein [Iocasia fonsfrigidae]QTL98605.1 hypothetical protein GM661_11840 [Iocasia fonsfrigidae]
MEGKITKINSRRGFAAIFTENNDYTVIEILGSYHIATGDIIQGNLETLGREYLFNASKDEKIDVFIQEIYASKRVMERLLNK